MARWILHVDMDAFFASVEQVLDPTLAGRPVIVAGSAEGRGVVSSASYEARRRGVRSAMPTATAKRLCPEGVFLPGRHGLYEDYSRRVVTILRQFTPLVEQASIDEACLDVTGCEHLHRVKRPGDGRQGEAPEGDRAEPTGLSGAVSIARAVKEAVKKQLGLSCSVGVGPNRLLAKMASGLDKPDGLTVIRARDVPRVLWPRPVSVLHGVGPRTESRLRALGVETIGDLARFPVDFLIREFGVGGRYLHDAAHGKDDTPVRPAGDAAEAKSLSRETTFRTDVECLDTVLETLLDLCDQVGRRLRKHGYLGRTVVVKVRRADFTTFTRSKTLDIPTDLGEVIYQEAASILRDVWRAGLRVRLLGVAMANVEPGPGLAAGLFDPGEKLRRVSRAVDRIRDRYGENAVTRARLIKTRGGDREGGSEK